MLRARANVETTTSREVRGRFFFFTHAPETTGAAPTLGHRSRASHNIETTSPAKRAEETRHAKRRVSMQKGFLLLRLVCSREKQSAGRTHGLLKSYGRLVTH